ncbi:glycosyltransferase family 4 protein [Mycobacterium kyogaense]|uniref:glycosyltransferase family 4 protein n=1 Tax=Mycobacterium kyogaense TaxID=2212479 RepID=UPI000DAB5E21|nr:glycosyltransferase family 4 protein [Mycobacterium kyogaense]
MTPSEQNQPAPSRKVLLLAKRFPPLAGGIAQYSHQVARAYARHGLDVVVVTQSQSDPGWSDDVEFTTLRVLNVGSGSQLVAFAKFMMAVIRVNRGEEFSFVHATTWKMGIVARLLMRQIPLVVTVHGREVLNTSRLLTPVMRNVLKHAWLLFAVSSATLAVTRDALGKQRPLGNWLVRYNGLTFPQEAAEAEPRPLRPERLELLSLSRLVPRKNIGASLRAFAVLRDQELRPMRLRIVGDGSDRAALEEEAAALGLNDSVEFLGYVDDDEVPRLYEATDIFLHPHTHLGEGNDFEGFGISIADAMSFGCASVVGQAGGPAELITDGIDGRLVDGLDEAAILAAIKEYVEDDAERANVGSAAKKSALERFSWDLHVQPALGPVTGAR